MDQILVMKVPCGTIVKTVFPPPSPTSTSARPGKAQRAKEHLKYKKEERQKQPHKNKNKTHLIDVTWDRTRRRNGHLPQYLCFTKLSKIDNGFSDFSLKGFIHLFCDPLKFVLP